MFINFSKMVENMFLNYTCRLHGNLDFVPAYSLNALIVNMSDKYAQCYTNSIVASFTTVRVTYILLEIPVGM